jgi:hypothetical protein
VPVKRLNQQVKRNQERFPSDFMFQLTTKEHQALRLQIATSKKGQWRPALSALRLHRARGNHGCHRIELEACWPTTAIQGLPVAHHLFEIAIATEKASFFLR